MRQAGRPWVCPGEGLVQLWCSQVIGGNADLSSHAMFTCKPGEQGIPLGKRTPDLG